MGLSEFLVLLGEHLLVEFEDALDIKYSRKEEEFNSFILIMKNGKKFTIHIEETE